MPRPLRRGTATLGGAPRFSGDASSIVILPALSDFAKGGRRRCLMPAQGSLFLSLRRLRRCGKLLFALAAGGGHRWQGALAVLTCEHRFACLRKRG
jgi:hypothetical protein